MHNGCRVAALDDVLGYYATVVDQPFTLRQLAPAVSQDSFVALRRFINRVDGLPFPLGPGPDKYKEVTGLMANYLAGQEGGSVLYGTYFCAQLVADSYMHMGLLEMEGYPPNGYSPAAFGMDDGLGRLPLVTPAALGAATPVEWDRPTGAANRAPRTRPGSRRRSWQPKRAPTIRRAPWRRPGTTGCSTTKTNTTVSSRAGPWRHSGETVSELTAPSVSGSRG
jgi:hypothetical protein